MRTVITSVGSVLVAAAVGLALAARIPVGVAIVIALAYLPVVLLRLPLAIALWAPLPFLEGVPALNAASKGAGLLLGGVWIASVLGSGPEATRAVLRRHRALVWTLGALIVWISASALWAASISNVMGDAWHWWAVGLVFLVVATSLHNLRDIAWVLAGMVGGALVAVLIGLGDGKLIASVSASSAGRLTSGAGDPNVLAAGLVAAIVVSFSLMALTRRALYRRGLMLSVLVLAVGLVATQSRGGFLAAVAASVVALLRFRSQRFAVAGAMIVATIALAVALAASPAALQRITTFNDEGNGRTELWTIALREWRSHSLLGVGDNNFTVVSPQYTTEPGLLRRAYFELNEQIVVHDLYLQVLAEDGLVGLLLLVLIICGCLRASWSAATTFRARGDHAGEVLANAVLVCAVAMLFAGLFLSAAVDVRLWSFLGLGLALRQVSLSRAPIH